MNKQVTTVFVDETARLYPCCAWEGCPLPARYAPQLRIPAKGLPLNRVRPLRLICKLVLCDDHVGKIPASVLITDAMRKDFETAAARGSGGLLVPDFDRAWVSPVSLNSPEYKRFARLHPDAATPDTTVRTLQDKPIDVLACINKALEGTRNHDATT